jgi:alkanesulfonate monooxygenase SsuD/methylene tetrahydromethanopterin reductase-like flavin-dependent oxidoreductase (luciferase family)
MHFSLSARDFTQDRTRPLNQQIEECAEITRLAARLGVWKSVRAQHHWASYPTIWLEPFPLLARLVPEAGDMQLMTSVVKPAVHNPLELAHQVATLDQMCNGRFILGIGVGYPDVEFESVGSSRRQRAPRVEESLALMKALWTGEEVNFEGRFWTVHNARMGYTTVQKPHPPIWNASYSAAATRRAARLCDGLLIANQESWTAGIRHAETYRETLQECGKTSGTVGINRLTCVARDYETAEKAARAKIAQAAAFYSPLGMDESSTLDMVLDPDVDPRETSIVGTPADCVEQILQHTQELGLDVLGLVFGNLPADQAARLDYIQWVSEEILTPCLRQLEPA